jgi:hypothetical protein
MPNDNPSAPEEPAEEYPLNPAELPQWPALRNDPVEAVGDAPRAGPKPGQFSLRDLLLLVLGAALFLGTMLRLFPQPGHFAGAAGILALLSLPILSWIKPQRTVIHLAWWALCAIYLLGCLRAIIEALAES